MPQTKQIQGIHKDKKSTDDEETSRPTGRITRLLVTLAAAQHPQDSKLHGPSWLAYGVIVAMKEG